MLSGTSDIFGTHSLSADLGGMNKSAVEQLVKMLEALNRIAPDLGHRSAIFVMSGQDADILNALAIRTGGGAVLRLAVVGGWSNAPLWPQWFAQAQPSAAVTWRLGHIFEAASRRESRLLDMQSLGIPAWMEILMWEASSVRPNTYNSEDTGYLDHALWEDVLALSGMPTDNLLKKIVSVPPPPFSFGLPHLLSSIPGLAGAVARHPDVVQTILANKDAKARVALLEKMRAHGCDPTPFVSQIVDLLVGESKTVREAAETWANKAITEVIAAVHLRAENGHPAQRSLAVEFLARRMPDGVATFLDERLAHEDHPNVKKVITDLQAQISAATVPQTQAKTLPPINHDLAIRPLGTEGKAAITALVEALYDQQMMGWEAEERRIAAFNASDPRNCIAIPPKPTVKMHDDVQRLIELLERPEVTISELRSWDRDMEAYQTWGKFLSAMRNLLSDPQITPEMVIRWAVLISVRRAEQNHAYIYSWINRCLKEYSILIRHVSGTRLFMAAIDRIGLSSTDFAWELLDSYQGIIWPLDDLWEWYYEHPEVIAGALGQGDARTARSKYLEPYRYANALALVEQFPDIPASLQPLLWGIALGGNGTKRGPAQRAVSRIPGMRPRVLSALTDGKQEVRLYAAEWLADLKDPTCIVPLEVAVKAEKSEAVKAAMMTALESLGVPIDRFLDRPGLAKTAAKGLAKGIPQDLAWLPIDALSIPTWNDGKELLSRDVLTWWIVQAFKLKDPVPTPLLRRYAAMLTAESAHTLGEHIVQAWIIEDTRPPTPELVANHIRTNGSSLMATAQMMATHGMGGQLTIQQLYDRMVEQYRTTPVGTKIACKGVLAVAAALGGPRLAPLVSAYLKRWYGMRAAQCKALLQMLAATEHPTAIHVLLTTATRFRTAGIRKEAEECVQEIARRHGWSVDELADRTIPTAGFDENGTLVLSYGERSFSVQLQPDLALVIQDSDNRTLAALPTPRAEDNAEAAEAAKKSFGEAKKQIKTIVKQQAERLYEAMCTSRRWKVADWQTYLLAHPVIGHLCRQVVWAWSTPSVTKPGTFRALEDGTLTDVEDTAVTLPDDAWVSVAHPLIVGTDIGTRWKQHVADYEVPPLFGQFDRMPLPLPESLAQEQQISDRNGHLIEAFKLRGRATKLGWTRGQTEDGGWFYTYRKHFTAAGITAVLEFTGNSLPEENRVTALAGLGFERNGPDGSSDACVLSNVPPPLLSECWNDLHEIAAQGTGFDPNWESLRE